MRTSLLRRSLLLRQSARHCLLIAFFAAGFFQNQAHAVIGETQEDLFKRYGAGKEVGNQMLYTVEEKYSLSVYFNEKKSSMTVYAYLPRQDGSHEALTDSDVEKFLKLEAGSASWNKVISKSGEPTWERSDKKVVAKFKPAKSKETGEVYKTLVFLDATLEPLPGKPQPVKR